MKENGEANKPFDMDYVLNITKVHMKKAITNSIAKTSDRFPEFANNPEKSSELFNTLGRLHNIKRKIDAIFME
jgi:hypothetical protein